ncbi:MAG: 2-oxoglutarate dehydrogenase complex dihydrolipoyllysine-residue succinyltransferase [Phycisphaerae bacterium]
MPTELKVPSAGESVSTVQIGEWSKSAGDFVEMDETIVELETDKASMDLPAPVSGKISKVLAKAGDTVSVGDVIAIIDESASAPAKTSGGAERKSEKQGGGDPKSAPTATAVAEPPAKEERKGGSGPGFAMPAAKRVAAQENLEIAGVKGSGPGGRILKEDVQQALTVAKSKQDVASQFVGNGAASQGSDRHEEVVPMTALRRKIAETLVSAQQTAALLTTFNEIDMTAVMNLRKERNEAFQQKYGIKLGFMSLFVKAAIDALKMIPKVNGEIRGTDIVYKDYYDIGVAVGTKKGLVVPVIRNAERLSFAEVELAIAELAGKARDGKLQLSDLQGGTFTISNGGIYGSLMSTPIINPPQSAILGLHAIQDRPIALDGEVVIRPMMYVALSYDHRIIDGSESVTFLKRIKECVEDRMRMLVEV